MLKLRIVIIGLFIIFVLLLSGSISAYSQGKIRGSKVESHPQSEEQCNKGSPGCEKLPKAVAKALIHYAANNVTPQQTAAEIKITAGVLGRTSPCNMLVFGLGYDSLLWATLNHGGRTVFLEEDEDWIAKMREKHPELESHYVEYPADSMVTDAYDLLKYAVSEPECGPQAREELEFSRCKLALRNLPAEIYSREWDAIMIDAPRGYFPEAPGRMHAIYTSALLAYTSTTPTHVFVHDVNRTVEDTYSNAFLCRHNLVAAQGSLWHFTIPPKPTSPTTFCST
jgi:glucuronoxylan 4-O-methyltransferase